MCKLSHILWSIGFIVAVAPWLTATVLLWVYTEVFEPEPQGEEEIKIGYVMACIQSASIVLYITYIPFAIMCIGLIGRRSLFSFCCLAFGLPVFIVVPLVVGVAVFIVSLQSPSNETTGDEDEGTGKALGITAGIVCLFSTAACLVVLLWALVCGSRGRGKDHKYPIPLAYFPFLRDFKSTKSECKVEDSERYTEDYPPPRYTFKERKPISELPWTSSRSAAKSTKEAASNQK